MYRLYKFVGVAFWAVILSLIICFFVVTGGPYCIKTQFDDHEIKMRGYAYCVTYQRA